MMRHRLPLLLALPALLGLLCTAALAQAPAEEVTPSARPAPIAPAEALGATLDELAARVQWLSQGAEAATQVTEALVASSQRLVKAEKSIAATAAALGQQLAAARDHLAELEAARAADGAKVAQLQAELEDARAEARVLGERLEANERVFEQLNAALTSVRVEPPKPVEAGAGEADRREAAGVGPRVSSMRAQAAAQMAQEGTTEPEQEAVAQAEELRPAQGSTDQPGPGRCNQSIEVEGGDTLFSIARRCETTVDVLMRANPAIKDPNVLWAGQQIALPAQMQLKQPD